MGSPVVASANTEPGAYVEGVPTHELASMESPKANSRDTEPDKREAVMPTQDFIDYYRKPLSPSVLSTPVLRVTRRRDDSELVPKRSSRLAAKSRYREAKPEAQARKVMLKKLGFEVQTAVPDEVSFEEFQELFALPLSASKREAMDILFPGRRQRAPSAARRV